jgi:hypothetical protein
VGAPGLVGDELPEVTANLTGFDPSRTSAVTQPDMPEATRVRLPKR